MQKKVALHVSWQGNAGLFIIKALCMYSRSGVFIQKPPALNGRAGGLCVFIRDISSVSLRCRFLLASLCSFLLFVLLSHVSVLTGRQSLQVLFHDSLFRNIHVLLLSLFLFITIVISFDLSIKCLRLLLRLCLILQPLERLWLLLSQGFRRQN